jgi:hypothetical protein
MSESNLESGEIVIKEMTIDQLAGAFVLTLGAIGSLLLVIWQSRCKCRCRIGCSDKCYIFDCSREPPPPEDKKDKDKEDERKEEDVEDEETPSLTPNSMGNKRSNET